MARIILAEAQKRGWKIGQLWYTHAHFDHFGGAADLAKDTESRCRSLRFIRSTMNSGKTRAVLLFLECRLTRARNRRSTLLMDRSYDWEIWNSKYGIRPDIPPVTSSFTAHKESVLFCGDLIFHAQCRPHGPAGGDWEALVKSIREQVFTLPDETRMLSGHGEKSTVGEEKRGNPFVGT